MMSRLDFGKETVSCYVEMIGESQETSGLQLLSIRYDDDYHPL